MATTKKVETVEKLTEKIQKSQAIYFADYRAIKHKQLEELRKILRKNNAEIMIVKNRLFLRAAGKQADSIKATMENTSAAIFAYEDQVAPLKELLKFFKTVGIGKTKGGLLGTSVITDSDVTKLSQLPPKQVLLAQLAGQLMAPLSGLHHALSWNLNKFAWALSAIKDKKQSN